MTQEPQDATTAYYDERWAGAPTTLNHFEVARLGAIMGGMSQVLVHSGRRRFEICDLGCGTGWLAQEMTRFGPVTGVDISAQGIEIARQRYPGPELIVGDVLTYRPGRTFDLILSSEVIEHIPDQPGYVRSISALLKPGGYLLLTCPNNRAKRAFARQGNVTQPVELWLSGRQLRNLLGEDLEILVHRNFIFDFAYSGLFRLTSAPKLRHLIRKAGLLPLYDGLRETFSMGLHHLVVAYKRPDWSGIVK